MIGAPHGPCCILFAGIALCPLLSQADDTGWFLESADLPDWRLQAGRFTAFNNQDNSSTQDDFTGYGATTRHHAISLAGAAFAPAGPFGGAFYVGELEDRWRQVYANLNMARGSWRLEGNLYIRLSLSHVSHRANQAQAGDDIDRLYLVIEYPLEGRL